MDKLHPHILQKGAKLTIVYIEPILATTKRIEVESKGVKDFTYPFCTSTPTPIFVYRGKRKIVELPMLTNQDTIILAGWDMPFKVDTELGKFRGNACLNFIGNPNLSSKSLRADAIRDYISLNLNLYFKNRGHIILIEGEQEILLYPDIDSDHAVVRRMKGLL